MNGFLVVANTPMDNVPVALLGGEEEARDVCGQVTLEMVQDLAGNVLSVDISEIICVGFVPFVDDTPGKMIIVRDMEEEQRARRCRFCRGDETASACECV